MKSRVYVTLKNGVLDPLGKAIHHALEGLGFSGVNDVRAGKCQWERVASTAGADIEPCLARHDEAANDLQRWLIGSARAPVAAAGAPETGRPTAVVESVLTC